MSDDEKQGADRKALTQDELAARAAEQRDRDAAAWAEREYDLARQNADQGPPQGKGGGWPRPSRQIGPPPPRPQLDEAANDFAQPAPPQFAMDTMAALAAVTQAMAAVAESLGNRSAGHSRGRDGDIVLGSDISAVFGEVPENILERLKYVKRLEMRLFTNTSGVRFKTNSEIIRAVRVSDDKNVATNFKMYDFTNVDIVVPFSVVFSDKGRASTTMIANSDGDDCYVPIPTRIMNKLSAQVYSYLHDKIPHSMRMLYSDCDKNDAFTLLNRIKTLEKQSLYTPKQVLEQRLEKIKISKLNDWNMFEPDMNDIIVAFDEHEELKQIHPRDNKSLKEWKDIIVEKTHHLFGDKLIEFINQPAHSCAGNECSIKTVMMFARSLVRTQAEHLQLSRKTASSAVAAFTHSNNRLSHGHKRPYAGNKWQAQQYQQWPQWPQQQQWPQWPQQQRAGVCVSA